MASIDWNDFVVVETIDLFENEELLPSDEVNNKMNPEPIA